MTNTNDESRAKAKAETAGDAVKTTDAGTTGEDKKEEPKGVQDGRLSRVASAIDEAIENIRGKLASEDLRGSVSDLVRLIQLRKELVDEAPRQVTVRWIDEWKNSPANDE